jgi:hypothetical protein
LASGINLAETEIVSNFVSLLIALGSVGVKIVTVLIAVGGLGAKFLGANAKALGALLDLCLNICHFVLRC